ncbi:MAG: HAMP domain-containing histidine kinase [Firmicutes bacterium]|nr:HAMP domain-containing histidine kinase [Bacillota bacterium]
MKMKNQLFISNASIILVSLAMLMAVMFAAMKIAEHSYMDRVNEMRRVTIVDQNGDTTILENEGAGPEGGEDTENGLYSRYKREITALFILFLTVGASAAALIFVLSNLFTRMMLKHIMSPIDTLIDAAKRVSEGDLDVPISYDNEDEFKEVCDTFDEMQTHLKEGIEKNLAYERARTTMITDISHDLRTPLTSVKGFLKGILDGVADTPEKQRTYVEIAYKKAGSMDALLDKLFYFSKLETDNMPVYLTECDLKSYLSEYARAVEPELNSRGCGIEFECAEGEYYSQLDKAQMNRVLDNLVENAVKYNGNVQIKICLYSDGENNVFYVSDNGSGVDEEKIGHLFERFYRADAARSSKREGSGLGLYIVKRIAELHGGTASAENDGGLKITITLPKTGDDINGQDIDC